MAGLKFNDMAPARMCLPKVLWNQHLCKPAALLQTASTDCVSKAQPGKQSHPQTLLPWPSPISQDTMEGQ